MVYGQKSKKPCIVVCLHGHGGNKPGFVHQARWLLEQQHAYLATVLFQISRVDCLQYCHTALGPWLPARA